MDKFLLGLIFGFASAVFLLSTHKPAPVSDDPEIARLMDADQADRRPGAGGIDWAKVKPRDDARLARIKELYRAGALHSPNDYQSAALVLQHGGTPEDYLLAHELCVIAAARGADDALWLAAASEDRFLMNLDRPQRFGTQYRREPRLTGLYALYRVSEDVTDAERIAMHTPPLAEALARAAEFNAPLVKTTGAAAARSGAR